MMIFWCLSIWFGKRIWLYLTSHGRARKESDTSLIMLEKDRSIGKPFCSCIISISIRFVKSQAKRVSADEIVPTALKRKASVQFAVRWLWLDLFMYEAFHRCSGKCFIARLAQLYNCCLAQTGTKYCYHVKHIRVSDIKKPHFVHVYGQQRESYQNLELSKTCTGLQACATQQLVTWGEMIAPVDSIPFSSIWETNLGWHATSKTWLSTTIHHCTGAIR